MAAAVVQASSDRISNLPPEITGHILRHLPLKDAVKTTILSPQWRHKWTHLFPQLILDHEFWIATLGRICPIRTTAYQGAVKYSNAVNNILTHHVSPIHKFVLDIPEWIYCDDINISHWVRLLSGKLVKEFTLFSDGHFNRENLPACMFSDVGFHNLTRLKIVKLLLPTLSTTTFRGFPCLISLVFHLLNEVETTSQASRLASLVSKCPLLETLDLVIHEPTSFLTIHAPKLQHLVVGGSLSGFFLKDTERLKTLSLQLRLQPFDWDLDSLIEFFTCLPLVESLVLGLGFWWSCIFFGVCLPLAKTKVSGELGELKSLVLDGVPLHIKGPTSFVLSLFRMTPKLQNLEILVQKFGIGQVCDITIEGDCHFDHLITAKVVGNFGNGSCTRIMVQLIKMILLSSPVLEVMTIEATGLSDAEKLTITRQLLGSTNAKIIF